MPSPKGVTINFDSNISKVVYMGSGDYTWTTSGETLSGFDWSGPFGVTLNAGYVIDSITTNNVTTVKSQTDTTFTIDDNFRTTAIITITSKQSTPQPTLTFKHFFDAGTIGSGTVKFRHYSQTEPLPQLATPQNVSASGTTVSWRTVENATSYEILVGGSSFGTVSTTSVDLSTLSGWASLTDGNYSVTVVAKADGYADSEPSAAVSVEKAASGETWVINENPNASTLPNTSINFTSNEMSFSSIRYFSSEDNPAAILYGNTYAWSMGVWINEGFRTITFETAPTGNLLTWLQANATKQ